MNTAETDKAIFAKKIYFVCSPCHTNEKHTLEENIKTASRYCLNIALDEGESVVPFAPHVFFTAFLDDDELEDREYAIESGKKFLSHANKLLVFDDDGYVSEGMKDEIEYANRMGIAVEFVPKEHEYRSDIIHQRSYIDEK